MHARPSPIQAGSALTSLSHHVHRVRPRAAHVIWPTRQDGRHPARFHDHSSCSLSLARRSAPPSRRRPPSTSAAPLARRRFPRVWIARRRRMATAGTSLGCWSRNASMPRVRHSCRGLFSRIAGTSVARPERRRAGLEHERHVPHAGQVPRCAARSLTRPARVLAHPRLGFEIDAPAEAVRGPHGIDPVALL